MNRVVHFEIPANNPQAVMKFFEDIFGWKYQGFGDFEYWIAMTGDEKSPGINGAIMKRRDAAQPIVNSIEVESFDAAAVRIEKAGGKIVVPKAAIPGMGWYGYFTDPEGNIHGLFQNDQNAK